MNLLRHTETMAVALSALGLALLSHPAHAAVTVYTSQTAFLAAIPGSASVSTLTFNAIADSPPYFTSEGNSFTEGGITFTTPATDTINIVSSQFNKGNGYDYGSGDVIAAFDGGNGNTPLTAALPNGTFAVGFDLGDFNASPNFSVALTPAGVGAVPSVYTAQGGAPTAYGGSGFDFVGFVSSSPVSSVTFSGPLGAVTGASFDNFTYAVSPNASPAPEPSQVGMLALMGLGLTGLLLRAGKRSKAA